jgi:hypothetical protein
MFTSHVVVSFPAAVIVRELSALGTKVLARMA